jgi:hypothetical protein
MPKRKSGRKLPKSLYEKGTELIKEAQRTKDPTIKAFILRAAKKYYGADIQEKLMNKKYEKILAFAFGVVFIIVLLIVALFIPNPSEFQYIVFRIVLALAASGVAAMIPGFLTIEISNWIRAGGALAVFVIVYVVNPVSLVTK